MSGKTINYINMDTINSRKITLDADLLLDAEMQILEGGVASESCAADHSENSTIQAPWGGCSSCNKTQSCQTHT